MRVLGARSYRKAVVAVGAGTTEVLAAPGAGSALWIYGLRGAGPGTVRLQAGSGTPLTGDVPQGQLNWRAPFHGGPLLKVPEGEALAINTSAGFNGVLDYLVVGAQPAPTAPPPPPPPPPSAPQFRDSSEAFADESSQAIISVPALAEEEDLLILSISGGANPGNVVETPPGWTPICPQVDAGETGHIVLRPFYRIRKAGDDDTVTCDISGFGVDNVLANMVAYQAGTFDAAQPIDGVPSTNFGLADPTEALSITTAFDNSLLFLTALAREEGLYVTPSGMTLRVSNGLGSCRAWDEVLPTAGASGARNSTASNVPWVNAMFAVKGA